jgi:hypothetical protein
MTRPKTNTVDYFPHDCHHGKTISILKGLYGLEGYAFWFQLLEILGSAEDHFLEIENQIDLDYLATRTGVSPDNLVGLLDKLAGLSAIHAGLWLKHGVIWCGKLVDRIADVYIKNRGRTPPEMPKRDNPEGKPFNPLWLSLYRPDNPGVIREGYPQSKVKESKVKESKVKKNSPGNAKPAFPDTSNEFLIFGILRQKIETYRPNYKMSNNQAGAKIINLMITQDNRVVNEMLKIIEWYPIGKQFIPEVYSAQAFRDKYDKLVSAREREKQEAENGRKRITGFSGTKNPGAESTKERARNKYRERQQDEFDEGTVIVSGNDCGRKD